jgi:hypothetical protein
MKRLVITAVSLVALSLAPPALAQTPAVTLTATCAGEFAPGQVRTRLDLTFRDFPAGGTTTVNLSFGINSPPVPLPSRFSPFTFSGSSGVFSITDVDTAGVTRTATIVASYTSTAGPTGTFTESVTYNCPLGGRGSPEPPAPEPRTPERAGYCLNGRFVNLLRGQPAVDPTYAGATPAFFYQGLGLSCDRLPGYSLTGAIVNGVGIDLGPVIGPLDLGRIYPYLKKD